MAALDPNAIVNVVVSTILAPFPSTFQQTGAIVSFGGTNLPPQTATVLTQFSDLESQLPDSNSLQAATWNSGVLTMTATNPLPSYLNDGDTFDAVFYGWVPTSLNGLYTCTVTDITQNRFSTPMAVDPGVPTVGGIFTLASSSQINAMVSTFFRQGTASIISVLELGPCADFDEEITAFETWLTNNTQSYYGYLLPEEWGYAANIPDALQVFNQFLFPEAMTYFWVTLQDPSCVGMIPDDTKCVIQLLEAPGVAATRASTPAGNYAEFTMAGMFYWAMQYQATAVTRVAPMCFKYIYGVTPYPLQNNGPLLVSLKEKFVNYIQTGAEGGINYTNVYQGVTADGFDYFNWWWTIDWVQINVNLQLSAAVINGSNDPLAPLYYNQNGINSLQATLCGTMVEGTQFGLVVGTIMPTQYDPATLSTQIAQGRFAAQCVVNAVPFATYTALNPSDYGRGEYDGLSVLFIPARGFVHILVTVVATNIVTL